MKSHRRMRPAPEMLRRAYEMLGDLETLPLAAAELKTEYSCEDFDEVLRYAKMRRISKTPPVRFIRIAQMPEGQQRTVAVRELVQDLENPAVALTDVIELAPGLADWLIRVRGSRTSMGSSRGLRNTISSYRTRTGLIRELKTLVGPEAPNATGLGRVTSAYYAALREFGSGDGAMSKYPGGD